MPYSELAIQLRRDSCIRVNALRVDTSDIAHPIYDLRIMIDEPGYVAPIAVSFASRSLGHLRALADAIETAVGRLEQIEATSIVPVKS